MNTLFKNKLASFAGDKVIIDQLKAKIDQLQKQINEGQFNAILASPDKDVSKIV